MKLRNLKTPTISKGRKLLASIPFLIVAGLLVNTWLKFYTNEYEASPVHYVTLVLIVLNGILLLIRFKPALLMTGVILFFASLGLLPFFIYNSSFLTIFGITIPFEGWSFLIFIFYFAINCNILINWQLDAKHIKPLDWDIIVVTSNGIEGSENKTAPHFVRGFVTRAGSQHIILLSWESGHFSSQFMVGPLIGPRLFHIKLYPSW